MLRFGWKRYLVANLVATAVALPLRPDALGVGVLALWAVVSATVLGRVPAPAPEPEEQFSELDLALAAARAELSGATGSDEGAIAAAPRVVTSADAAAVVSDFVRAVETEALREYHQRDRIDRRFRTLVENSDDIIAIVEDDQIVTFVNPAGPRLLGLAESDIVGSRLRSFAPPEYRPALVAALDRPGGPAVEIQLETSSGLTRWFDVRVSDLTADHDILGRVVTASEISGRKQAHHDLQHSEARFRSLVQHASNLVVVLDADGIVSWVSPSSRRILGVAASEAVDRTLAEFGHPGDVGELAALVTPGEGSRIRRSRELRLRHATAGWRTMEVTATNLLDDPAVGGIVLDAHDVTEWAERERRLRHQALHDDLTGLPNRSLFHDRLRDALAAAAEVAVLVIDLDDFKAVNDGLGHAVGDELLQVVAERLRGSVRAPDVPARLGGDEFAVLLADASDPAAALGVARRLLRAIEEPVVISGRDVALHASIGLAFDVDVADADPETMLRSADLAMYGAKNRGKSRVAIFDRSMHEGAFERLELKADLARALDHDELLLHYQPVIDLDSGAISGFEALMRWNHTERGMIGPGIFIPLAEETGLIVPLGRWVADAALGQLRQWQDRFPSRVPLTMSINVSRRQLEDPDVVADITRAIAAAGVDPSTVALELSESVVVDDSPDLLRRLDEIRSIGVGIYADDFGAGFASFSALQTMPFTGVKIDRSLVNGLEGESSERVEAQVASVIRMASKAGMRVVAEGIESAGQADTLRRLGCDLAQGFYFSRPVEEGVMDGELLRRQVLAEEL